MNPIQLISAILKGKWLIEPNFAISQGHVIASILNKQAVIQNPEQDLNSAFAIQSGLSTKTKYSFSNGFDKALKNSIAVISLNGPLMKNDMECGPLGMASIGNILKAADQHPNIDAIVLKIDSPGGTVDGTETLGTIVKISKNQLLPLLMD